MGSTLPFRVKPDGANIGGEVLEFSPTIMRVVLLMRDVDVPWATKLIISPAEAPTIMGAELGP